MRTDKFDYYLPENFIAQKPLAKRDASRLMVLDRELNDITNNRFFNIANYFDEGDVLVINTARVIPARLVAHRSTGAKIEILLLKEIDPGRWETLVKPGRKTLIGETLYFSGTKAVAHVISKTKNGGRLIEFQDTGDFWSWLNETGHVPLPPYIKREDAPLDLQRYQTVYADKRGAVAAPTAGLHFTEDVLDRLKQKGVEIIPIVLHVGLGTFRPVKVKAIEEHRMDPEYFSISDSAARKINLAKEQGRRIFATGTTCVRALESAVAEDGRINAVNDWTNIFIYPPYKFKIVDKLVTNFHLPRSTLLMLVASFAGIEFILKAYRQAVAEGYRFYSYGDVMLIL